MSCEDSHPTVPVFGGRLWRGLIGAKATQKKGLKHLEESPQRAFSSVFQIFLLKRQVLDQLNLRICLGANVLRNVYPGLVHMKENEGV
jgi:hypothetical protein